MIVGSKVKLILLVSCLKRGLRIAGSHTREPIFSYDIDYRIPDFQPGGFAIVVSRTRLGFRHG